MRFVECSFDFVQQKQGIEGAYEMMEHAARQCYKSEDLRKEGSAHKIIDNVIIPSGHTSILEFGTIYLKIPRWRYFTWHKYKRDRYSRITLHKGFVYVTTTYRTILQGRYKDPVKAIEKQFNKTWKKDLKYWSEPEKYHHKRYTYHFVMDRVGSQSVVRHRGQFGISYAQESTRFINYHRDKFGNEITVCYPAKFYDLIDEWSQCCDSLTGESFSYIKDASYDEQLTFLSVHDRGWCAYENALRTSEEEYMFLIGDQEWRPEDARGTLNLDIKTEFLMCAYEEDWDMFFFRRTDKHAHHQIRRITTALKEDAISRGMILKH